MYHLVGNYFIDHISCFVRHKDPYIITNKVEGHPVSLLVGRRVGETYTMESFLERHFGGSEEAFWKGCTKAQKVVFCCDNEVLFRIFITYWKSIFVNNRPRFFYLLYELLRKWWSARKIGNLSNIKQLLAEYESFLPFIAFDDFCLRVEQISPSSAIRSLDKGLLNFEYLFAGGLASRDFKYFDKLAKGIRRKLYTVWMEELTEIRSIFLQNFFQLRKDFEEDDLKWIFDPKFNLKNLHYVQLRYGEVDFEKFLAVLASKQKGLGSEMSITSLSRIEAEVKDVEVIRQSFRDGLLKRAFSDGSSHFTLDYLNNASSEELEQFALY